VEMDESAGVTVFERALAGRQGGDRKSKDKS
jgi:hypothetical protein